MVSETRNLPAFSAHWINLHRSRGPHPKEISSETDSTPPSRRRQAENPTAARPPGHGSLARSGPHRPQHPLRGRHQDPSDRLRRHRCHPSAGPQARPRRGHRRPTAPAQVPLPLPRVRPRPQLRLQRAVQRHLPPRHRTAPQRRGLPRRPGRRPHPRSHHRRRLLPPLHARRRRDPSGRLRSDTRLKVWAEQPADFFDQAIIDIDGTLVATTGVLQAGHGHRLQRHLGLSSA